MKPVITSVLVTIAVFFCLLLQGCSSSSGPSGSIKYIDDYFKGLGHGHKFKGETSRAYVQLLGEILGRRGLL